MPFDRATDFPTRHRRRRCAPAHRRRCARQRRVAVDRRAARSRARSRARGRRRRAASRSRRSRTPRWTAMRCAAPICRARAKSAFRNARCHARRRRSGARSRPRRMRAHHDRRAAAARRGHGRHQGTCARRRRLRRRSGRRIAPVRMCVRPARISRPATSRRARARSLTRGAARRARVVRHRRRAGRAASARRAARHRRRARAAGPAARLRPDPRQQSLQPRRAARGHRHRRRSRSRTCATMPMRCAKRCAHAAATCDVVITQRRRFGRRGRSPAEVSSRELGRVHFWKVRMKPGMPFLCGEIGKALVFALPGNPVSSLATFLTLVKPGLMAMQGADETDAALARAARRRRSARSTSAPNSCARVSTAATDGQLRATPVERQGSGMLRGVAEADCLIVVPEDVRERSPKAMSSTCCRCRDAYLTSMNTRVRKPQRSPRSARSIRAKRVARQRRRCAADRRARRQRARRRHARRGDRRRARRDCRARIARDRARPASRDSDDLRQRPALAARGGRRCASSATRTSRRFAAASRAGRRKVCRSIGAALDADSAERYARHLVLAGSRRRRAEETRRRARSR